MEKNTTNKFKRQVTNSENYLYFMSQKMVNVFNIEVIPEN